MRSPYIMSDEELSAYADIHITYALKMLITTARAQDAVFPLRNTSETIPWVLNNGLLNAFSMYARNLIDFLYARTLGKNKTGTDWNTDVIIEDFADTEKLQMLRPVIPEILSNAREKADLQVGHLSLHRATFTQDDWGWQCYEIASQIAGVFKAVEPAILPPRISPKFRDFIARSLKTPEMVADVINDRDGVPMGIGLYLQLIYPEDTAPSSKLEGKS